MEGSSDRFAYKYPGPHLLDNQHIRLLTLMPGAYYEPIHCRLESVALAPSAPYEALSYVWGDQLSHQKILLFIPNSESSNLYSVTSNCAAALRRLRYEDRPRLMWIDALCIDQLNDTERGHQVMLMSKIYFNAARVVIYLGEESGNSNAAIDLIADSDNTELGNSLDHPKSDSLIQALNIFFHRPWFSRIWVVQEVAFASNAVVMCGTRTFDWSTIKHFRSWNISTKWLERLPFVVSAPTKRRTHQLSQLNSSSERVLYRMSESRDCQATDPRDKIYALLPFLNLADLNKKITPNYEHSPAQVFTDFASILVNGCRFDLLQAVQSRSQFDTLPSWVPDWTSPLTRMPLEHRPSMQRRQAALSEEQNHKLKVLPKSNAKAEDRVLQAYGHCEGTIASIGSTYVAGQTPFPYNEWKTLAASATRVSDPKEADKQFGTVLLAGRSHDTYWISVFMERISDEDGNLHDRWHHRLCLQADEQGTNLLYREIPFQHAGAGLKTTARLDVERALRACHSRRFCITDSGLMGLAPVEADLGDRVYTCVGAPVLFAFRDVGEGERTTNKDGRKVKLVGECYIPPKSLEGVQGMGGGLECLHIS